MEKQIYTLNDKKVYEYILENENIKLTLSNYGASIKEFLYKPKKRNILTTYKNPMEYILNKHYLNTIVAPTAGRIEKGQYTIKNNKYVLDVDSDNNNLHSGKQGFSFEVFDAKVSKNKIVFSLKKEYEVGFKNIILDTQITYTLLDNGFSLTSIITPNYEIFLNPTLHTYFNLSQEDNIFNHYLKINADYVYKIKENKAASLTPSSVLDTIFDLRDKKNLGELIRYNLENEFLNTKGLDNPFKINRKDENKTDYSKDLVNALDLNCKDLTLKVYTTLECVVVYTANFFDYLGVAIEAQNHPNAINQNDNQKYVYSSTRPYASLTKFEIKE